MSRSRDEEPFALYHHPDPEGWQDQDAELPGSTPGLFGSGLGCWGWWWWCVLLLVVFYGPVFRAASRVPGMERELTRLRAENARVRDLSAALDSAESRYAQVRQMMGGEIVRDPLTIKSSLPVAPPIRARLISAPAPAAPGLGIPQYWPLDETGYITRGQVKAGGRDEAHPGIDIAVSVGSLVRASGGAVVQRGGGRPGIRTTSSCSTIPMNTRPCTDTFRAS